MTEETEEMEDLESFRQRARSFIRENLQRVGPMSATSFIRRLGNDEEDCLLYTSDAADE